jgi:hypothetical protein
MATKKRSIAQKLANGGPEMRYVVILEVDEDELDGVDSVENACSIVNNAARLVMTSAPGLPFEVTPLSEEFAC